MKNSLIAITSREDRKKQSLQKLIKKKTVLLEELMEKAELLKMELETISHEYHVRIGTLLLKDNQLDLEILQLKNLQELMKSGMTYQQAMKFEEDAFYSETLRMQQEQERLEEEKKMLEGIQDVSDDVMEEVKIIWKKLIRKFHPDLVTDPTEKQKREDMMKKINKAYTERNLEVLQQLEQTQTIEEIGELTISQLELSLDRIESSIRDGEGELNILQNSTWYEWKKKKDKAKQEGLLQDVFAELEQKFLDDIVKKIEVAQKLRQEVHPHGML